MEAHKIEELRKIREMKQGELLKVGGNEERGSGASGEKFVKGK